MGSPATEIGPPECRVDCSKQGQALAITLEIAEFSTPLAGVDRRAPLTAAHFIVTLDILPTPFPQTEGRCGFACDRVRRLLGTFDAASLVR